MIPAPATQKLTTYMRLWTTQTQAQQNRLRKNNKFRKKWGGAPPPSHFPTPPVPGTAISTGKNKMQYVAVKVCSAFRYSMQFAVATQCKYVAVEKCSALCYAMQCGMAIQFWITYMIKYTA